MDVWFCKGRDHGCEAFMRAAKIWRINLARPSERASAEVCFLLTIDYMEVRKGHVIGPQLRSDSQIVTTPSGRIYSEKCRWRWELR